MATRSKANLPVNYSAQLAAEALAMSKKLSAPSGDRIRYNTNRELIAPDGTEGEELEVVVVDFVSSNLFYDSAYDQNTPQSPACFAVGDEPSLLTPSADSPVKQAATCSVCPNNQFNSAGKGKACKNTRLVAVMPLALDGEEPPIWVLSIPPTSLKAFDGYVSTLAAKHKTSPIGVVTKITLDSSIQYAAPRFSVVRPLKDAEFETYMSRREEAKTRLIVEPDFSRYVPITKTPARGAPAKRGVR